MQAGSFRRYLKMDLRNIFANPWAFTLPIFVILVINLFYLNATLTDVSPQGNIVEISTYLLLNTLFGSLLSIPLEIREKYAERIQYEFSTYSRRLAVRLVSNTLVGIVITVGPYLFLTIQSYIPKLALTFYLSDLLKLFLAVVLVSILATLIGALFKSYLFLSIFGSLIFLLQVSSSIDDENVWAFSTFVSKLLDRNKNFNTTYAYVRTFLLEIQLWIIATSPIGLKFNRGRGRETEASEELLKRGFWARPNLILPRQYALALAQETSIRAHMAMIPFSLVVFLIYPLMNSADAFSVLLVNQRVPILGALLSITVLSCVLSMGAYKLSRDEQERDALAFGSLLSYLKITDRSLVLLITCMSIGLGMAYLIYLEFVGDFPSLSIAIRTIFVILIAAPMFGFVGRRIVRLRIDVRFYVLFALVIPLGEMIISGVAPQVSGYLPSSILAHLAGGRGLYELITVSS
jgi:hypothetical protein